MKYFVVSDIHSCYEELLDSLAVAGYDINNPDHTLIVCGDLFDRGPGSKELYYFIRSIPKNRRILIRGNHEFLFRDLYQKGYIESHDISNGTVRTMSHFMGIPEEQVRDEIRNASNYDLVFEVYNWIFNSGEWRDYYELPGYIFVHSFIPVNDEANWLESMYGVHHYSFDPDWRNASIHAWEEASWGCPYKQLDEGLFDHEAQQGKTLVYGHWHAFRIHLHYDPKTREELREEDLNHFTYFGKNSIALDACTPHSHFVNILVIDDDGNILNKKEN